MWIAIFSGLVVSIDALFIGVSLGSQKRCRFWHLLVINAVLLALCFAGYALGLFIGDIVDLELDILIGILFIALGLWTIACYFIFEKRRCRKLSDGTLECEDEVSANKKGITKNIVLTGIFMSIEAMFITIGLTLLLDTSTILIPLTVGLAHFVYCTATFFLAKHLRRLPPIVGPIVAGICLIIYGIMALVI
ncbi:MAG: manganese efflux pump [Firmicutes bacterium]|nr:manganese efflux pump [Bacillota bacterium]